MPKNIILFGEQLSWFRVTGIIVIGTIAILCATTVGEFAVSVHNRYSVYPLGTDTNMYGNSTIGSMLVCLVAATVMGLLFCKKIGVKLIPTVVIMFFVLGIISSRVSSFLPEDWCRYELTMYRCSDQLDPLMNIKQ